MNNNKKEAFEELLKLAADPNIENSSCVSPLVSVIRNNDNCDLYFVKRLLDNGAKINPKLFEKCNQFSHDPICETIVCYNDVDTYGCGFKILKLLT
jgi:ankyrin repeat protein